MMTVFWIVWFVSVVLVLYKFLIKIQEHIEANIKHFLFCENRGCQYKVPIEGMTAEEIRLLADMHKAFCKHAD